MAPGKPKIEFENEGKDVAAGSMNRLIERLTHETTFGILFFSILLFPLIMFIFIASLSHFLFLP